MNKKIWKATLLCICCAIFCMGCKEDLHVSEMPETESNVDSEKESGILKPDFVTTGADIFEGKELESTSFQADFSLNGEKYSIGFE
ncbi:MAG: hypothetical protein ACI4TK_09880 [Agathobacter sp.]